MENIKQNKNWMIRLARILGILFAAFISLFALDVFEQGVPFVQTLTALLIHLIPTFLILAVLWIAWRWSAPGGVLFILAGISYILLAGGQDFIAYLLISGIPILIGSFFLLGFYLEKRQAV